MPPKFARGYEQIGASARPEQRALMDGNSDDEDFFLHGPSANPGRLFDRDVKMTEIRGQVGEVVGVMQDNIGKVLTRGERLEDLESKSESLTSSADMFATRSRTLKNQMWWRECKMRILFALVIVVILAVIFVPIIVKYAKKH